MRMLIHAPSSPGVVPRPTIARLRLPPPRATPHNALPPEAIDLLHTPLDDLTAHARHLRDATYGNVVTFSPKVFIPLTRLCRDACGYCTFAQPPKPGKPAYMSLDEVLAIAHAGAALGATEALFTLGDKPELLYPQASDELAAMGYATTLDYVEAAARAVLQSTTLIPHINAGVMDAQWLARLRRVSASQGLMLESTSQHLLAPGQPHYNCPDKDPALRVSMLHAAGFQRVPFTSGLLIGIGESREDRLGTLCALRDAHREHGHLQEVIVQPFRAKGGTAMADAAEPDVQDLVWTVAAARVLLDGHVTVQVPPNLTPSEGEWQALLDAGVNDWGGVSPLTRDFVNPEAPWPQLAALAAATAAAGKTLLPRLPVHPRFIRSQWLDNSNGAASVHAAVLRAADGEGLGRASSWAAGRVDGVQHGSKGQQGGQQRGQQGGRWAVHVDGRGVLECCAVPSGSEEVDRLVRAVVDDGHALTERDIVVLLRARGVDFDAVCSAADSVRRAVNGDTVTYVVNRNINYTNICTYKCTFCAFSKGSAHESLRGTPYLLPLEEVQRRAVEAWERGATEVCMQGGIHPDFTGQTYIDILRAVKDAVPSMHVHAFSPLEVSQGAATLGLDVRDYLQMLKDAGLGSLPGTAAEILDDDVRALLCPDKLTTHQWLDVVQAAHSVGLRTTSTIMFGHVDDYGSWARHLLRLRALQERTGGVTEFVPLPFVHMAAPVFLQGKARPGPTLREAVLLHAVARLALHPSIPNIQASWVKLGPDLAAQLLCSGCNDMGGSIMNESITRAAGAAHGQELPPEAMELLIRGVGRVPKQRTTLYGEAPEEQVARSFACDGLVMM